MASVASALVQKLNRFFPLNQDELASLAGLEARRRPIPTHTEIVHERQEGHRAFILQEGWACAYKLLPDGGRQVIDFSVRATSWACAACSCAPRTMASRP